MNDLFWAIVGSGVAIVMTIVAAADANEKRLDRIARILEQLHDQNIKR